MCRAAKHFDSIIMVKEINEQDDCLDENALKRQDDANENSDDDQIIGEAVHTRRRWRGRPTNYEEGAGETEQPNQNDSDFE